MGTIHNIWTIFTIVYNSITSNAQIVNLHPNSTLILVGTRHGYRNPAKFLPLQNRDWGFEGTMELTALGKQQSYGLGLLLRNISAELLSSEYFPAELRAYSSSANRCQMTLQTVLAGIYPPVNFSIWSDAIDWTPVPYSINDPLLRMYKTDCDQSASVWKTINDETYAPLAELKESRKNFIAYVTKNSQWTPTIANMADAADNIDAISRSKGKFPDWWTQSAGLFGYPVANMTEMLMEFQEQPQIGCSQLTECRDLMAGVWLQHLINVLQDKSNNRESQLKVEIYVSHTEITLSIMKLLHIELDKLETASGFLIEFCPFPTAQIRILHHKPAANNPSQHLLFPFIYSANLIKICNADNWCPLDEFIQLVYRKAIVDWQSVCHINPEPTKKGVTIITSISAILFILLVI